MKRVVALLCIGLFILATGAMAATDNKAVGDPRSVDTKYDAPFNVNLEKWFASHPVPEGKVFEGGPLFETPRVAVMAWTNKGQNVDLHYHTVMDEIVFVVKGTYEQYVDGKWVTLKAGDLHYNPRGIVHGTRMVGKEPVQAISILTPPSSTDDRVMLESGKVAPGTVAVDWKLVDTHFKAGGVTNLDAWYAAHPIPEGAKGRGDNYMGTPRNQVVIGQNPAALLHYHGSIDEVIYTYKGAGEVYTNGEWVKAGAGDISFCPKGFIHAIRPTGTDFKGWSVSAPPQADGNDRTFVESK